MMNTFQFGDESYEFYLKYKAQKEFRREKGFDAFDLKGAGIDDLAFLFYLGFKHGAHEAKKPSPFKDFEDFENWLDKNYDEVLPQLMEFMLGQYPKGVSPDLDEGKKKAST